MKSFLSFLIMFCVSATWAADTSAPVDTSVVNGKVLEVMDVGSYTYLRLKTEGGETWAAVGKTPVIIGEQVTIEEAAVMEGFESKSLQKTFDKIVFGVLGGSRGQLPASHASVSSSVAETADGDVKVTKASGSAARTVAEIVTQSAELKDETVLVRGKVVKYNAAVMGKNWIHLRDGSGSASNNSNDVLVTTSDQAKLGDIVVAKGVVRTDKNFGSGYLYKVLVEDAALQK